MYDIDGLQLVVLRGRERQTVINRDFGFIWANNLYNQCTASFDLPPSCDRNLNSITYLSSRLIDEITATITEIE